MASESGAVLVAAGVTSAVALAGFGLTSWLARGRPTRAAWGAPFVVVAALAAGVASASRMMLLAEDARGLIFVLLSGAPIALLCGLLLARRVRRIEERLQRERADRERAAAVERDRREMIQWLSHDLRTPLSGIRILAEAVGVGAADPAEASARITREVDRLDAMVDDIAELSRLQSPARSELVPLPLVDLVSDAAAAVHPLADAAGVRVVTGRLDDVVVPMTPRSVVRAVTDLLRNAVRHTGSRGMVGVSVTAAAGFGIVEVTDQCGGIAEADLPRVFDAGWRGDPARGDERGSGGMGLGLAIVREVARGHGGTVEVRNLPDGSGCAFTLRLPTDGVRATSDRHRDRAAPRTRVTPEARSSPTRT